MAEWVDGQLGFRYCFVEFLKRIVGTTLAQASMISSDEEMTRGND